MKISYGGVRYEKQTWNSNSLLFLNFCSESVSALLVDWKLLLHFFLSEVFSLSVFWRRPWPRQLANDSWAGSESVFTAKGLSHRRGQPGAVILFIAARLWRTNGVNHLKTRLTLHVWCFVSDCSDLSLSWRCLDRKWLGGGVSGTGHKMKSNPGNPVWVIDVWVWRQMQKHHTSVFVFVRQDVTATEPWSQQITADHRSHTDSPARQRDPVENTVVSSVRLSSNKFRSLFYIVVVITGKYIFYLNDMGARHVS